MQTKSYNAFALISAILILGILTIIILGFLSLSGFERRISQSGIYGQKAYYLAEAGIAECIWKLKNDENWRTNFESNPAWSAEFTRENPLGINGSYTVQIQNTDLAKGEISASSKADIGNGKFAQRIIQTNVFKAINTNPLENIAIFSDEDITINSSAINIDDGSIFTNNNLDLRLNANVLTTLKAQAVNRVSAIFWSSLTAGLSVEANQCIGNVSPLPCQTAPDPLEMPMIDFDSNDANSYKNRAIEQGHLYASNEFRNMLSDNPNLTLDGISYVTGAVQVKKGQSLTVNGLLVADGNITIGTGGFPPEGRAFLTFTKNENDPSGVLSKSKISIGLWSGDINGEGLMYALDSVDISNFNHILNFNLTGGILTRKLDISGPEQTLNITYNGAYINDVLGAASFSPTITIDHWEEEY